MNRRGFCVKATGATGGVTFAAERHDEGKLPKILKLRMVSAMAWPGDRPSRTNPRDESARASFRIAPFQPSAVGLPPSGEAIIAQSATRGGGQEPSFFTQRDETEKRPGAAAPGPSARSAFQAAGRSGKSARRLSARAVIASARSAARSVPAFQVAICSSPSATECSAA